MFNASWIRRHFIAIAFGTLANCWLGGHAQAATVPSPTGRYVVLVVGDSLSAEYGLRRDTGWVKLMERRVNKRHIDAEVVNASISGDTTSGGRSRLAALLARHHPSHVIIELGANDALRGLPVSETAANLTAMARTSQAAGAQVVLVGIQVPPNYGRRYTEEFAGVFTEVARAEHAALVPFLLKGVADAPESLRWFQADRIHPKEEAQPMLLDNVWPVVEPLLKPGKQPARIKAPKR